MGIFTKVSHNYAKVTRLFIAKVTQKIRKFAKKKNRVYSQWLRVICENKNAQ